MQWQKDVAASLEQVGDLLFAQGDLGGALAAHRRQLVVYERLTAAGPDNDAWRRAVAVTHNKIGNTSAAKGQSAEAERPYDVG